ncbi:alpha/beta hydrolase [Nocardia sp. NPDC048505]|uniref:alpha/beta fold hydrolase n=1 Tax=unclassified Nocardia TaxID=2637762 RepID=UPI0033D7CA36
MFTRTTSRLAKVATVTAAALTAMLLSSCSEGSPASPPAAADQASADGKGHYAEINGGRIYYETHGTGAPLILLHGGLVTGEATFGAMVPELAKTRQVVLVDLQAHGHSPDFDRPLSYEALADDVAALTEHLALGRADVLGYSLGGGVALQMAARTPELVDRLIIASAPFRSSGWLPETRAGMAAMDPEAMRQTPLYQMYTAVAPNPAGWADLVTKTRQLLTQDYDWTTQLDQIRARTLVLTAESDALARDHAVEMVARFEAAAPGRARLETVPGTTHNDITFRSDLLLPLLNGFLDDASK